MSEDQGPDQVTFHKAPMVAATFGVQCPVCDMCTEIGWVDEDDAGVWHPRDDYRFIRCQHCDAGIEVEGVKMEGVSGSPFRNTGQG